MVADHDIFGLEVAVHQTDRVRSHQPLPRPAKHLDDLGPGTRRGLEPSLERLSLHELHGDEYPPVVIAHVVHGDDVRVGQASHRLGLAEQAAHVEIGVGQRSMQQLDRDLAAELRIVGGVHRPHASDADLFEQHVPTEHRAASGPVVVADVATLLAGARPGLGHDGGLFAHEGASIRQRGSEPVPLP